MRLLPPLRPPDPPQNVAVGYSAQRSAYVSHRIEPIESAEPPLIPRPIDMAAPGIDPASLDHLRLDGVELSVVTIELKLVTERSARRHADEQRSDRGQ